MPATYLTRGGMRLAIVGRGRLGTALTAALCASLPPGKLEARGNLNVVGPLGRGADADGCDAALLCVPDREIGAAAAAIKLGLVVGHCSGATGLEPLAPHEAFSLHPLMTVTGAEPPSGDSGFAGTPAVIDASTERAMACAHTIAVALQMRVVHVAREDRVAYHAAASVASNFLLTVEAAAERIAATAGISRELLAPLVKATVENWAQLGPERALTGPLARGDERTVARQRAAIAERTPELLTLFDTLADATRSLAAHAASSTLKATDENHPYRH